MKAVEHKLIIKRTAHVFGLGDVKKAKNLWIVCHGYGQRADRIIRKFDKLSPENHVVLAPEGISKFYWNQFSGEPVASWMTKMHRLDEIEDYCNYLDQVLSEWKSRGDFERIILFGFSQGCATLWRWIHARQPQFDVFFNWAGSVPEDISFLTIESYLKHKEILIVFGKQDPFLTPERKDFLENIVKQNKIQAKYHQFEGAHTIDRSFLQDLMDELSL